MRYVSKVGNIYATTLTAADTWTEVLTAEQAKCARGIKVKSRYVMGGLAPSPFDYAFSATPGDNYISNSGGGFGDEIGPVSGLWVKSPVVNTVIEVLVYV